MKNTFKLLAIGDICGPLAVDYLNKNLWKIRKEYGADMVVANGENCSEPNGVDKISAKTLLESGVDVITTGNHVFRKSSVFSYLDDEDCIVRPLNYPDENPGKGDTVVKINGYRVLVLNVMGQAYMDAYSSPFEAIEKALERNKGEYDFAVLDIHAEATGEKKAIAYEFSDRISVAFGTHTHVQTNDPKILNGKCGYITDLGMVGARDSILGVKKEAVIYKLKTKLLSKFDFAEGKMECGMALFEIDLDTFNTVSVKNFVIGEN